MSRTAVKCPWKKFVEIPSDVSVAAGEDCLCPASCPNYKLPQRNCSYARFNAKNASAPLDGSESEVYAYTPEEIVRQFPKRAEVHEVSSPAPQQAQPAPMQTSGGQSQTPSAGASKYVLHLQGRPATPAPVAPVIDEAPAEEVRRGGDTVLQPARKYDAFELRGIYYTFQDRANAHCLKDPARRNDFFRRILETFDVASVMDGTNVKDAFLWVLNNALVGQQRCRAVEVLNANVSSGAERFFLLFYYAIFFDRLMPLYWATGYTQDLRPIYRDVNHFYRKIASGTDRFYVDYSALTLLWLRRITLSEWEDETKKRECLQDIRETVAVESLEDVVFFWEAEQKFVCLGRKESFVNGLVKSDKPLETLEATAVFLSRYDIVVRGGQYRVVPRIASDAEYRKQINQDEINDEILRMLFSFDRSLNKAELYLYIVKRYCELFRPASVQIGGVTFNRGTYTEQIEDAVDEMYAYFLGDAAKQEQLNQSHTKAVLVKLLYQKDVLFQCPRDASYMEALLGIVSNESMSEERAAKAYFAMCKRNGRLNKIKLFALDYEVLPHSPNSLPLLKYMRQRICTESVVDLSALLKTPVFAAYKEVFCAEAQRGWQGVAYYREQERKVLETVASWKGGRS